MSIIVNLPPQLTFTVGNDQSLTATGLFNQIDQAYVNNATVVATLLGPNGQPVVGLNQLMLNYIAASNGVYRGIVLNSFAPPVGEGYKLLLDASVGQFKGHWEFPVEIAVRNPAEG